MGKIINSMDRKWQFSRDEKVVLLLLKKNQLYLIHKNICWFRNT